MRKHYDFSDAIKNPYVKKLKKQVTIRLDLDTLDYFRKISAEADMPYQKLINLFLRDCAEHHKKPAIKWELVKIHS